MSATDYPPPPTQFVANEWLDWIIGHPNYPTAMRTLRENELAEATIIGWALGQRMADR